MNYKFNKVQSYKKKLISKHLLFIFFIRIVVLVILLAKIVFFSKAEIAL